VSLILDALKKIEREKGAGDPGVVVLGSVPWGEKTRRPRRFVAAAAVLVFGFVGLGAWWLLRPARAVAPAAAPSTAPTPEGAAPAPASARPPATATTPFVPPPPAARRPAAPAAAIPAATDATTAAPAAAVRRPAPDDAPSSSPPAPAGSAAWPELRLGAISVRDGHPVALVNDRLVREGDAFDGVSIVRIGDAEVEVEFRGERRVLRF